MITIKLDKLMCTDAEVNISHGDIVQFILPDGTIKNTVAKDISSSNSYCRGCIFCRTPYGWLVVSPP